MRLLFAFLTALATFPAFAQPASGPTSGFDGEASYSYSSDEHLEGAGARGSVAVHQFDFNVLAKSSLSATDTLTYGVSARITDLDLAAGTSLPEHLRAFALHLSGSRRFTDQWTGTLTLRPGLYGDLENIDSKSFNIPLLVAASYADSRDLVWLLGVRVDVYAEHPVLPLAGVRWRFAPDWSLNIAFPRSGVQWRVSDALSFDAGVSLQGGTYRLTENLGIPPGLTTGRLANTFLDYREIRVGIGAEFSLHPQVSLRLDLGAFVDREFDYFDRGYTLESDSGTFATIALRSRF